MATNYSVKVRKHEKIERVIKRFIKKTKKLGIIDEAKERRYYMKPSEKKRLARKRSDAKRKKEEAKRKK